MKNIIILLMAFLIPSGIICSQEIIMEKTFKSEHDYLRNTYLFYNNNFFYISGFSEISTNDAKQGVTSLIKFDKYFNHIWEINDTLDNTTIPLITFENKDKNLMTLSNYGSLLKYLHSQIADTSGNLIYSTDSVSIKNNFLITVGKYFINFDFNIYHIYNSVTDTLAKLVLQTYDNKGNYIFKENIFYMDSVIYRDLEINDAILTKDSGFVITGDFYNKIRKKYDMYLLKFDMNKKLIWSNIISNDSAKQIPSKLIETDQGKLMLVGWLKPYLKTFNRYKHFIKQFDSGGNIERESTYFKDIEIFDTKIYETSKGNYYVIANTLQRIIEEPPFTLINFCLLKIDSKGNIFWKKEWGDPNLENQLKSIVIINENEIVCSGYQGDNTYIARIIDTTTTNVKESIITDNQLIISPNPSSNKINIKIERLYNSKSKIEIYNLLGIKQTELNFELNAGENSIPVDVSSFSCGVYFVVFNDGNVVKKAMFVKE